jgi:hypothetical protein
MKLLIPIAAAFKYFSVATVLAQAAGLGWLAATGRLEKSRVHQAFALVYGAKSLSPIDKNAAADSQPADRPSYEEIAASRWRMTLDLDLRETALEKALVEYGRQTEESSRARARYDRVKGDFDRTRASQLGLLSNPQLQEVRRTLEAIKPAQAKEELRKMLADGSQRDVVALLKSMPLNKRKKIVAEFKATREADELEAVFKEIRLGHPEVDLIRQTRGELQVLGARAAR